MERNAVSDQPHEIKYEAQKEDTSQKEIKEAKKSVGNQREAIGKKVK